MPPCISFGRVSLLHCMSSSPLFLWVSFARLYSFCFRLDRVRRSFVIQGLVILVEVVFDGIHSSIVSGFKVIPQSVNVGVNFELFQYVV